MASLLDIFLLHPSVTIDSRSISEGQIFFAIKGDHFDGHDFINKAFELGASYCVASDEKYADLKGVIMVNDTIVALQQLARDYRNTFDIPFFAITGSNGKTTTKELLARVISTKYRTHMTKGNLNNHLGVPLTILAIPPKTEFAIIEMGANHIGEVKELCEIALPTHGMITNIGIAHLEGFGSIEGIRTGKSELMNYLKLNGGVRFVNREEKSLQFLIENEDMDQEVFGETDENSLHSIANDGQLNLSFTFENKIYQTNLVGQYNFNNILSAYEIGHFFQCEPIKMLEAISSYMPDNNRSQKQIIGGVTFLLDAYNANPSSVHNAINNIASMKAVKRSVILGDMLELGVTSVNFHLDVIKELSAIGGWEKVVLIGPIFSQHKDSFPEYTFFKNTDDALFHLDWKQFDHHIVLLKGSRGLRLERLLPQSI